MVRLAQTALLLSCASMLLTSCNSNISRESCVSDYAQKGGTEQIVRWGYQLCTIATDAKESSTDRSNALCAVKKIPSTPTELAFRQVIAECRK